MGDDDPDDLATLRRAAYSREGTAHDRARLVEAEAHRAPPLTRESAKDDGVALPAIPRRIVAVLLVAAVALGVAASVGVQLTQPRSSLRIFERAATLADSPPIVEQAGRLGLNGGTLFGEIRYIGAVDEGRLYAVQGIDIQKDRTTSPVICLVLVGIPDSESARAVHQSCSSLKRFLAHGLAVDSQHPGKTWRWGPTGNDVRPGQ